MSCLHGFSAPRLTPLFAHFCQLYGNPFTETLQNFYVSRANSILHGRIGLRASFLKQSRETLNRPFFLSYLIDHYRSVPSSWLLHYSCDHRNEPSLPSLARFGLPDASLSLRIELALFAMA